MIELLPFILGAWLVLAVVLFATCTPRRAILVIFLAGVLFLPEVQASPPVPTAPKPATLLGFPLTKLFVLSYGTFLAAFLFDRQRWFAFRPRWFDLPMLAWSVAPLFSSLANNLGVWDGLVQGLVESLVWVFPYFIGRVYFADADGLRELAIGIVLGGLVYVPLCFYEGVMGPQLHRLLFGFEQHEFVQSVRLGGYRPLIFMQHGLEVGLWMWTATLTAFALARGHAGRRSRYLWLAFLILLVTGLLFRSALAFGLGLVGLTVLMLAYGRWPVLLLVLVAIAPTYILLRATTGWSANDLVQLVAREDPERAASLNFRLQNEEALMKRAEIRPFFGWGAWGRADVPVDDEFGTQRSVPDGLWIIVYANRGVWGLIAVYCALLLPPLRFAVQHSPSEWARREVAPLAAAAVVLVLFVIDGLLNNMPNPVFLLAAGGLSSALSSTQPANPAPDCTRVVHNPEMVRPGVLRHHTSIALER